MTSCRAYKNIHLLNVLGRVVEELTSKVIHRRNESKDVVIEVFCYHPICHVTVCLREAVRALAPPRLEVANAPPAAILIF